MEIKKSDWEKSYKNLDNFILYPKEEVVKFLNRFVRKKVGFNEFHEILLENNEGQTKLKALDFGCGIGRQTILLEEFGIEGYGVDISENAIITAKEFAGHLNFPELSNRFSVIEGLSIPFEDNFFDISIAEACLDSMGFKIASIIIKELDRVTKSYLFMSLISGDDSEHDPEFIGDERVKTKHEENTIQSFYNLSRIKKLIKYTRFNIVFCRLLSEESTISRYKNSRYYVILNKN